MKIFISEADRQSAKRIALKNLAKHFSIPDWESKTNDELYNDLDNLKDNSATTIFKLLKEYFIAYDEWFMFYQERKKKEIESEEEYILNSEDKEKLGELIMKRQTTLDSLEEKFTELQLSRFNSETFGKDITGTIN